MFYYLKIVDIMQTQVGVRNLKPISDLKIILIMLFLMSWRIKLNSDTNKITYIMVRHRVMKLSLVI